MGSLILKFADYIGDYVRERLTWDNLFETRIYSGNVFYAYILICVSLYNYFTHHNALVALMLFPLSVILWKTQKSDYDGFRNWVIHALYVIPVYVAILTMDAIHTGNFPI